MNLNLSKNVIDGLKNLGSVLSVDLSKKLIANAVKLAIHQDANIPSNPEIYASKPDYAKQCEYAVVSLLFLATKYGYDNQKLRNLLEQYDILNVITDELINVYDIHKKDLLIHNLKIGYCLQHITDIEWKLTCNIKSSTTESYSSSSSSSSSNSSELLYKINLGRYNEKSGNRENIIEFVCNVEELQAFINRLKEIERHCERLSIGK